MSKHDFTIPHDHTIGDDLNRCEGCGEKILWQKIDVTTKPNTEDELITHTSKQLVIEDVLDEILKDLYLSSMDNGEYDLDVLNAAKKKIEQLYILKSVADKDLAKCLLEYWQTFPSDGDVTNYLHDLSKGKPRIKLNREG